MSNGPRVSIMNRRRFLLASAAGAAAAVVGRFESANADVRPADPFEAMDATALADLVRRREVQPMELLEAAMARIAARNPRLNAMVTPLYERARTDASRLLSEGPFGGVPYAIKDMVDLKGTRRTAGSRLLAENISTDTTEIVDRSLAAGLVVLAKTNMPEFALNATTEPVLFGPARNPWNLGRSTGGSSGGSAAAVAAGLVPFAHASDGGGSIRIPASCCGLFGLKPSRGRMVGSRMNDAGVEHCVSRSVRDSAALFVWNQRQDAAAPLSPIERPLAPGKRRLKIGFATPGMFGREPAPAVKTALEQSARLCETLGHHVEPARLPVAGEEFFRHFMVAWSGGAQRVVQQAQAQAQAKDPEMVLEPWTRYLAAHFRAQSQDAGSKAAAYFAELTRTFATFFADYDVMLTPVVDDEPPELGYLGPSISGEQMWERLLKYVAYTPQHNVAGTPAMSVPLGTSPSGLPIGSHFAARIGDERTLFELALELEQAQPWQRRRPDMR
jgi:amidase